MVYPGSGRRAVRPAKAVCEGTILSCTRSARSRGYRQGERGREAPKSLLEEKLSVASIDVRLEASVRFVGSVMPRELTDRPNEPILRDARLLLL